MNKNKLIALVALIISYLVVISLLTTVIPDTHEIWNAFVILTIISAIIFHLPGAAIGTVVSIAVGVWYAPTTTDTFIQYGLLALASVIIGWYANQQEVQEERLGRLLMIDRLTGLRNYSYFIDRLEEERKRSDRFGSRVSLIMIDLDHFKPFNDKYGHEQGNELLKYMAGIFKAQVRGVDIVCRYGGEEFAVLLPNTGHAASYEIAERIRATVEESEMASVENGDTRTVSIGVATYPNDADDDLQLIDRADEALHKAKEAGRNKVVVYGQSENKPEALSS